MRKRRALLMSFLAGLVLIGAVAMAARAASASGALGMIGSIGAKEGSARMSGASAQRQYASQASANQTLASRKSAPATSTGQATSGPAATACAPWSLTTSQIPNSPTLYSAAAISATNVWAVGTYFNATLGAHQTLIEHFNGSAWSVVASPSVGTIDNRLQRVTVISPNDIWAVGQWQNLSAGYQTLIEHWDGTKWSVITTPNVTGGYDLTGVSAVSSDDVWAAGMSAGTSVNVPLVEHWNGSTWSMMSVPAPGTVGNTINDIAAIASNDVWIVGTYQSSGSVGGALFEHWDGVSWTVVPVNPTGWLGFTPNRIAAIASDDIWVVGAGELSGSSSGLSLTEHWNGSTWSLVSSPNPSALQNVLTDAVALSPYNVWAVGFIWDSQISGRLPVVMHWNGVTWSVAITPATNTYSQLLGVAGVNPLNIWAVGTLILNPPGPGVASKGGVRPAVTTVYDDLIERYNPLVMTACK